MIDPRKPETYIAHIDEVKKQFDDVMRRMDKIQTTSELAPLEREANTCVVELMYSIPRLHEAFVAAAHRNRKRLMDEAREELRQQLEPKTEPTPTPEIPVEEPAEVITEEPTTEEIIAEEPEQVEEPAEETKAEEESEEEKVEQTEEPAPEEEPAEEETPEEKPAEGEETEEPVKMFSPKVKRAGRPKKAKK